MLVPRIRISIPSPFPRLWEFVAFLLGLPGRGLAWAWRWICDQGRIIRSSPRRFYILMGQRRDWVVAKIEYAHTESAKWRAMWTAVKLPYTALRAMGLNPQMAIGLIAVGGAAGTAAVANEMLAAPSFSAGDHGVYTAPHDSPVTYSDSNNTLRIELNSAAPVGEIFIENVSVGTAYGDGDSALPAGATNVLTVGGDEGEGTYLEVGTLTIDRNRCTQFIMNDTEAYELNIKWNISDGQSIAPVPSSSPRNRAIGGGNRADSMQTSGGLYDMIVISSPVTNGKVDKLTLSGLLTKGGPCVFSRIKAGTIDILYNESGNGDGWENKDFQVATSTIAKTINIIDNVEEDISPP